MKGSISLSFSQKIVLLLFAGLLGNAFFLVRDSEEHLEALLLEQAKEQARIHLLGLSAHIESMPVPWSSEDLRVLLKKSMRHANDGHFGFVPREMYIYDATGKVLAHTEPGEHPDKDLLTLYGDVIRHGESHVSDKVEYSSERDDTPAQPVTDVIVPIMAGKDTLAGLEAEIDLTRTMERIKDQDNEYERGILIIVSISAGLLFALFWRALKKMAIEPVTACESVTRRIGGGDLSARVPDTALPGDELGNLGRAINAMADSISELLGEREKAHLQMMQTISKALEAKDSYTAVHSNWVAHYSVKLGKKVGLSEEELSLLKRGALVHDLGKIGIPDAILNKPGPLTDEEFAIMRRHPELTASIMRPLARFKSFTEIATWHHERWDGKGYPDGLAGEDIPLAARIVSIADTWDAMTGNRVYRLGMPVEKALSILEREKDGGQWDPNLVRVFIGMVREEHISQ